MEGEQQQFATTDGNGGMPVVVPYAKRNRRSPVTSKIIDFLEAHPQAEFSLEQIAKEANLSYKQTRNSMSGLRTRGIVSYGTSRGFWKWNENGTPLPPRHNRTSPTKRTEPAKKKEVVAAEDVLFEVLRVRKDGDVVLIDTNGEFWVARKVDI
jgi:predicted transcriptional regulator